MGEYSKSNFILRNRKNLKMTRAELSEGICDELTLLRYEKGLIDPTDEKFYNLMVKMGQRGECYIIPYTQENINYIVLQNRISKLLQQNKLDECEACLSELINCDSFDLSIIENKQYVERLQLSVKYTRKELSPHDYISSLTDILSYTFKDYHEGEYISYHIYSENELMIMNNIATTYGQIGELEKSFSIFDMLLMTLRSEEVTEFVKPYYKIFVNYSNLLGLNKMYDQCIEICQQAIDWLMKRDYQNLLYNFYFNIGWVYSEIAKSKDDSQDLVKQAKAYVWLSYIFCSFFPEASNSKQRILSFYEQLMAQ